MKKLLIAFLFSMPFGALTQERTPVKNIKIKLENNSMSLYKLALLSFEPGQDGNGTRISNMLPYMIKEYNFPVGTALYFGNNEQINYTMSGKNINKRGDKPDLVLKPTDDGKTFQLKK